jgi:hypothetical protein
MADGEIIDAGYSGGALVGSKTAKLGVGSMPSRASGSR